MAYEQKENTGSLFKNDKKTADTHPNATGQALIGGVEYWVSSWTKEGKNGKWQSLSFRRKDDVRQVPAKAPAKTGGGVEDMEDDIPF